MKQFALTAISLISLNLFLAGCATEPSKSSSVPAPKAPAPVAASPVAPSVAPAPATAVVDIPTEKKLIRIKAGASTEFKDSDGNLWMPDQGFDGGDVIERPDVNVTETKHPELYRSEHYGMESFRKNLLNGKYTVKLHFAETFEGISGAGERVFSFIVQGKEFKDFDISKKTGGTLRAYVETVDVDVTDGKLVIRFVSNLENPEINAIEIIPQE